MEQQARVKGKKGFRPEYNPLMGGGGGAGYRCVYSNIVYTEDVFDQIYFIVRPAPRRAATGGG